MNKKYLYRGVIHIHSKFSDGTGNINQISLAAKKAGLDFIIITDHNSLDIEEGIYNNVIVIRGEEISKTDSNHFLALGTNENIKGITPKDFTKEINEKGGFGFIAHPFESRKRKNGAKPIVWENFDNINCFCGIEIWNWFSNFADNYDSTNIFKVIKGYLFKHKLVRKPNRKTLNLWDKLNLKSEKIIPAIGSTDAHALIVKDYFIPVCIFPYETLFKTIQNIIYLNEKLDGSFEQKKALILSAIKNGNNLILNNKISKNIPEIYINSNNQKYFSGEILYLGDNNSYINIENLKNDLVISIYKDSKLISRVKDNKFKLKISEKGKYRVEIKKGKFALCYSNPIEVKAVE